MHVKGPVGVMQPEKPPVKGTFCNLNVIKSVNLTPR